ncbi:hypothetical protein HELRODRAFT_193268 [Helobdella robusta]|uniref:Uncharacterized protein n=1 Tax=Helobdella robusta TaxID=6412 RepID=T1FUT4_HELRO|nr:hypothetical protein HELRODRAFT_193268 [Helobdella robusta]ESN97388.1 hypothetical protein HELRODRAFT_193268 [Helobdella robusta]
MKCEFTVSLSQHHPIAFEKEPYDVTVFQGHSLILDCAVHSPTPYEVVWLKDSSIIKTYDSHRQLLMNNSLYIQSFDESSSETDAGTYQCEARIKNVGSVMSRRATVVGRPREVHNVTLHVSQDGNIFMPCYDDQLKLVDHRAVEWLKNGQKMNVKKYDEDDNELTYKENLTHLKHDNIIQHVDAQLEIVRAKFHHAGIYECMMYLQDDFKKIVKRLNLIVDPSKDPNKRENYNVSFFEVNARVGETTVLECLVDSHESGKFSWTKNDELIRFSEGKYEEHGRCSLYIKNVSSDDAAFYKLHVETSKRRYSKQTHLNVQSLPSFVEANAAVIEARVDEDVLLKCRVHAEPHPTLEWLKNGDVLMNNEYLQVTKTGDLQISNLFSSDAGLYQCVADNRLGNIQAITQLLVHNIEDYESNSAEIASDSLVSYVPHNVNVRATDSKSLLVTWQFSHFDRDSIHFLEFLVQHKRAGEDDLYKMITSKIDGHKRSLEINDLPRNSEWLVRMCAVVNNSTGMYTEWTSARTLQYDLNEMKQPGRLSSLNVQSTSTSLNISWTPPVDGTIKIRGYKLSYGFHFSKILSKNAHNCDRKLNKIIYIKSVLDMDEKYPNPQTPAPQKISDSYST